MAEPTTNQQWWTPEFAQQSSADAMRELFAQAAEQGTVTLSHQTPFASGAAEPVYPVEGAIGGAAVGGLSRTAINALFEMAAKNAERAKTQEVFEAFSGTGGGGAYGQMPKELLEKGRYYRATRAPSYGSPKQRGPLPAARDTRTPLEQMLDSAISRGLAQRAEQAKARPDWRLRYLKVNRPEYLKSMEKW